MKNNFFILLEYLYYFSLVTLFIMYFFPGSLIGYFLYDNSGSQPNIINNPIGTSINHLFFFIYISLLGLFARSRRKRLINSFQFLFFVSIFLEFFHFFIPNRAFEYYDLFSNSTGVVLVYLLSKFFKKIINR